MKVLRTTIIYSAEGYFHCHQRNQRQLLNQKKTDDAEEDNRADDDVDCGVHTPPARALNSGEPI